MKKKVAIIASNGDIFNAYKVFNIANAAAATDMEVTVFFTFEGLNLIHKQGVKNIVMPKGMENLEEGFKNANVPSVEELALMAQEMDVKFIACQMTMDVMGINNEDLFDNIEVGGAVTLLEFAKDADITLSF